MERFGGSRDECLVKLLLNTGIRVEEAIALRWSDIQVRERSGTLIVRKGKGRKQRSIPLNAEARAALTGVTRRNGKNCTLRGDEGGGGKPFRLSASKPGDFACPRRKLGYGGKL